MGSASALSMGGIHEWGITYDWLISRSNTTELEFGPSENLYSPNVSHSGARSQRLSYRLSSNEALHCVWVKGVICAARQSSGE